MESSQREDAGKDGSTNNRTTKVIYDEDKMSHFEISEPSRKRKRRVSAGIIGTKVCENEEDLVPATDDDQDSEHSDDSEDEEDKKPKTKRKRTKKSSSEEPVSCQYCGKQFTAAWGLKYHVEKFVCRPSEKPQDSKEASKPKRKRGKSLPKGESSYKRIRGPLENRTCNKCGRVFTSSLGLQYHAQNKVCQGNKGPSEKMGQKTSYHTLAEGEEFVTSFGVVRVVKDDRAVPADVKSSKDFAKITSLYRNATGQYEKRMKGFHVRRHAQLRFRREKINELYETDGVSQQSVFAAYEDPIAEQNKNIPPDDPFNPPEAYPDRIVECLWIADKRRRHDENGDEQESWFHDLGIPMKLYLRRCLLKETYHEDGAIYGCVECGQHFYNHPSWKYHSDNRPCRRKKLSAQNKREESEKKILMALANLREKHVGTGASKKRVWKKKKKRKPNYGLYPEVLISLGFKLVAEEASERPPLPLLIKSEPHSISQNDPRSTRAASRELLQESTAVENASQMEGSCSTDSNANATVSAKISVVPASRLAKKGAPSQAKAKQDEDPRILYKQLQRELKEIQSDTDRKQYGPMYPEVYKGLGFYYPGTFPRIERNIVRVETAAPPKKKKKKKRKPAPKNPPVLPLAPIVDPKALVDEVLSGRYPSMKPFEAEHLTRCSVCKQQKGYMLCCNFCKHVEHMACFRTKFTTKAPEPGEEFMCHKCIGVIITRRNRAEKRRLNQYAKDKGEEDEKDEEQEMDAGEDAGNQEYQLVAERGRETNELVELLTASQIRLKQSVQQMEANNLRRMMFG